MCNEPAPKCSKKECTVVHKPSCTLGHLLLRPKDCVTNDRMPDLIHKIPCAECPSSYICDAKNPELLIRRHMSDVQRQNRGCSAIFEHCEMSGQKIDCGGAAILKSQTNLRKRLLLESWHLRRTAQNLNCSLKVLPTVCTPELLSTARCFE